jgi:CRISPR-associated Csx3 family protein
MRVIVLRKQFVEGTPAASETEQTTSGAEPTQISGPKPIFLHIVLAPGLIETDELNELLQVVEKNVPAGGVEPIILSGRLPVWVFSALTHHFHARPWVATFEPRYGEGIVTATHVSKVRIGQRIPVDAGSVKFVEITFPPTTDTPTAPDEEG